MVKFVFLKAIFYGNLICREERLKGTLILQATGIRNNIGRKEFKNIQKLNYSTNGPRTVAYPNRT